MRTTEELFLNVPMIGDMYYHHIYLFCDEPLVFSCQTKAHHYYFVVAVPSSNSADASWLVTPISLGRLIEAERNRIEIRRLITEPEAYVCLVDLNGNDTTVNQINLSALSDDMLPKAGTKLSFVEFLNHAEGCPLRHENGNCNPVGGFCTSVNNEICTMLHNAYTKGYSDGAAFVKRTV